MILGGGMRLGKLQARTGDPRADAIAELRWGMAGAGLTIEKLAEMEAVRRLPVIAASLSGVPHAARPKVAYDALCEAVRALGDGLYARFFRNSLAVDYSGAAKDLTARRDQYVQAHNDEAGRNDSRNVLPLTNRAHHKIEQKMLESLVTALGAPPGAGEPATTWPPIGVPVPRQLPAAAGYFAGRAGALDWLDANAAGSGDAPAVIAIDGTAGVGKTALALRWAHRAAERFPDGQLYLDLRGYSRDGEPLSPTVALNTLLHALGVPTDAVVQAEDQLAGAYRSVTAGKRLLVLLDNAASIQQVRPLVPGSAGCVVLVTSRNALPGLAVDHGARVLTLDALGPADAAALLVALLGEDRAEPDATADLAELCGYLPLALRIVAAKLQAEPYGTVADMAARLRERGRLASLGFGNGSETAVRAAFDLSYESLPEDQQRAFRLLGLVPGVDVGPDTAAALFDVDQATAAELLDGLAACHLAGKPDRDRYQLHDLLRDYANELCRSVDNKPTCDAAVDRLLTYYIHRTLDATKILHPKALRIEGDEPGHLPKPAPLADREEAVAWLTAEQPNLAAAVPHALAIGWPRAAWRLAWAMRGYFMGDPSGSGWVAVGEPGLMAARRDEHLHAVSAMHGLLGRASRMAGDLRTATAHVTEALEASEAAMWPQGEVIAHCTLGGILQDQGLLADAIRHHQAALEIDRRTYGTDETGAVHLTNIGLSMAQIGEFASAVGHLEQALGIMRRNGDERGAAIALESLGSVRHRLGKLADALDDVSLAVEEYRRMEFRDLEAEALSTLARICCDAGDVDAAERHAAESLQRARALGEARIVVVASNTVGYVALRADQPDEAETRHREALGLAEGIDYLLGQVEAAVGLASAAVALGRPEEGRRRAEAALAQARAAGLRNAEARSLTVLGRALRPLGAESDAREAWSAALAIHRSGGCAVGENEVLALLGEG